MVTVPWIAVTGGRAWPRSRRGWSAAFPSLLFPQIMRPELALGTMEQDPEVVSVYAELRADFVPVPLLEEKRAEQLLVPGGQLFDDATDEHLPFLADEAGFRIGVRRLAERILGGRGVPALLAQELPKHVVADRVHEGAQGSRIAYALRRTQGAQDPQESLLADVLNEVPRSQAAAELEQNQRAEVRDEVTLCFEVAAAQALQIGRVELLKFQGPSVCWG